jgi:hypothetical protein
VNHNASHDPVRLVDVLGDHELWISSDERNSSFHPSSVITRYLKKKQLLSSRIECIYYNIKLAEEMWWPNNMVFYQSVWLFKMCLTKTEFIAFFEYIYIYIYICKVWQFLFQTVIQLENLEAEILSPSDITKTWHPEFVQLWHKEATKSLKWFFVWKHLWINK